MNQLLCLVLLLTASSPAPGIVGTIVDDRGKSVSGISIAVHSLPSSKIVEEVPSGADGSFRVTGLAPGAYGVEAKTESACAFSDAIQVEAGYTSTVHLRLVKGLCDRPVSFAKPPVRR
jgi:hypothetical protein